MASRETRSSVGKQVGDSKTLDKVTDVPEVKKENCKHSDSASDIELKKPIGRARTRKTTESTDDSFQEGNPLFSRSTRFRSASLPPVSREPSSPKAQRKLRTVKVCQQRNGVKNHVSPYHTRSDTPIHILRSGKQRSSILGWVFDDGQIPLEYRLGRRRTASTTKDKTPDDDTVSVSSKVNSPGPVESDISTCNSPVAELNKICVSDLENDIKMPGLCSADIKSEEGFMQETRSEGDQSEINSDSNLGKTISHKISALIKRGQVSQILQTISRAREERRAQAAEIVNDAQKENSDSKNVKDTNSNFCSGLESSNSSAGRLRANPLAKDSLNSDVKPSASITKDVITIPTKDVFSPAMFYKKEVKKEVKKEDVKPTEGMLKSSAKMFLVNSVREMNRDLKRSGKLDSPKGVKTENTGGETSKTVEQEATSVKQETSKSDPFEEVLQRLEKCVTENYKLQLSDVINCEPSTSGSSGKERRSSVSDLTSKKLRSDSLLRKELSKSANLKLLKKEPKKEVTEIPSTAKEEAVSVKQEDEVGNTCENVPSADVSNREIKTESVNGESDLGDSLDDKSKVRRSVRSSAQKATALISAGTNKPKPKTLSPCCTDDEASNSGSISESGSVSIPESGSKNAKTKPKTAAKTKRKSSVPGDVENGKENASVTGNSETPVPNVTSKTASVGSNSEKIVPKNRVVAKSAPASMEKKVCGNDLLTLTKTVCDVDAIKKNLEKKLSVLQIEKSVDNGAKSSDAVSKDAASPEKKTVIASSEKEEGKSKAVDDEEEEEAAAKDSVEQVSKDQSENGSEEDQVEVSQEREKKEETVNEKVKEKNKGQENKPKKEDKNGSLEDEGDDGAVKKLEEKKEKDVEKNEIAVAKVVEGVKKDVETEKDEEQKTEMVNEKVRGEGEKENVEMEVKAKEEKKSEKKELVERDMKEKDAAEEDKESKNVEKGSDKKKEEENSKKKTPVAESRKMTRAAAQKKNQNEECRKNVKESEEKVEKKSPLETQSKETGKEVTGSDKNGEQKLKEETLVKVKELVDEKNEGIKATNLGEESGRKVDDGVVKISETKMKDEVKPMADYTGNKEQVDKEKGESEVKEKEKETEGKKFEEENKRMELRKRKRDQENNDVKNEGQKENEQERDLKRPKAENENNLEDSSSEKDTSKGVRVKETDKGDSVAIAPEEDGGSSPLKKDDTGTNDSLKKIASSCEEKSQETTVLKDNVELRNAKTEESSEKDSAMIAVGSPPIPVEETVENDVSTTPSIAIQQKESEDKNTESALPVESSKGNKEEKEVPVDLPVADYAQEMTTTVQAKEISVDVPEVDAEKEDTKVQVEDTSVDLPEDKSEHEDTTVQAKEVPEVVPEDNAEKEDTTVQAKEVPVDVPEDNAEKEDTTVQTVSSDDKKDDIPESFVKKKRKLSESSLETGPTKILCNSNSEKNLSSDSVVVPEEIEHSDVNKEAEETAKENILAEKMGVPEEPSSCNGDVENVLENTPGATEEDTICLDTENSDTQEPSEFGKDSSIQPQEFNSEMNLEHEPEFVELDKIQENGTLRPEETLLPKSSESIGSSDKASDDESEAAIDSEDSSKMSLHLRIDDKDDSEVEMEEMLPKVGLDEKTCSEDGNDAVLEKDQSEASDDIDGSLETKLDEAASIISAHKEDDLGVEKAQSSSGVSTDELSPEDTSVKEPFLSALGLGPRAKVLDGREHGYTGTLKTVIKVHRSPEKRGSKFRFMVKNPSDSAAANGHEGRDRSRGDENGAIGEKVEYRIHREANLALDPAATDLTNFGIGNHLSTNSPFLKENAPSGENVENKSGSKEDAKGHSKKEGENLVIPEKSSSFSIHPGRLCSDVCSYCFGKFGSLDTPCHIAQLKNVERQQKILTTETHLTADSCLCDACYRHVDRKANCPSYNPSGTRKKIQRTGSTSHTQCVATGCAQPAVHQVRRKWMVKLKRCISKKVPVDMDQHQPFPLCSQHYFWVEHYMQCGLCKRRLSINHMYLMGPEVHQLNQAFANVSVPVALSEKIFVCKLCRYFCQLCLKYQEQQALTSGNRLFCENYRKKILYQNEIEVSDSDDKSENFLPPKSKRRKTKSAPSDGEDKSEKDKDKEKDLSASTSSIPPVVTLDGGDGSNSMDSTDDGRAGASTPTIDYSSLAYPENSLDQPVLSTPTLLPPAPLKQQPKVPRIRVKVGNTTLDPSTEIRPVFSPPAEMQPSDQVPQMQANFDFRSPYQSGSRKRKGDWEMCAATLQFTKETKKDFMNLQRPYGNHSSFIRHLVLLEKYWRSGDLVLSPNASSRAVSYISSVETRIKSLEGTIKSHSSAQLVPQPYIPPALPMVTPSVSVLPLPPLLPVPVPPPVALSLPPPPTLPLPPPPVAVIDLPLRRSATTTTTSAIKPITISTVPVSASASSSPVASPGVQSVSVQRIAAKPSARNKPVPNIIQVTTSSGKTYPVYKAFSLEQIKALQHQRKQQQLSLKQPPLPQSLKHAQQQLLKPKQQLLSMKQAQQPQLMQPEASASPAPQTQTSGNSASMEKSNEFVPLIGDVWSLAADKATRIWEQSDIDIISEGKPSTPPSASRLPQQSLSQPKVSVTLLPKSASGKSTGRNLVNIAPKPVAVMTSTGILLSRNSEISVSSISVRRDDVSKC